MQKAKDKTIPPSLLKQIHLPFSQLEAKKGMLSLRVARSSMTRKVNALVAKCKIVFPLVILERLKNAIESPYFNKQTP